MIGYSENYLKYIPGFQSIRQSLISLLVGLSIGTATAQVPGFNSPPFVNSLETSQINDIYQAPDGLIWLGTSTGLYRCDGFSLNLIEGTALSSVTKLHALKSGGLLAGFESGAVILIRKGQIIDQLRSGDSLNYRITGLVEDDREGIWISSYGDGLFYFENGSLEKVSLDDPDQLQEIYGLLMDEMGRLWLGSDRGIYVCKNGEQELQVIRIGKDQGLPDNIVRTLTLDENGNVWIGMQQKGVCKFDMRSGRIDPHSIPISWDHGQVNALEVVNDHLIWVGTEGDGIVEFDLQRSVAAHRAINSNKNARIYVHDVLIDDEGNGWISDNISGLLMANLSISSLDLAVLPSHRNVQAMAADVKNNIWFTTDDGLWEHQFQTDSEGIFTKHLDSRALEINMISLYIDIYGGIWIGTFGQGVLLYDPINMSYRRFTERDGMANDNVLSIAGDEQNIWFATLGGASKVRVEDAYQNIVNPNLFINYHDEHGLGTDYIYQAFIDARGRVWFATDGKGLTVLEGDEFRNYPGKDIFESGIIYSITEDAANNIWFSTAREGILKYDGVNFTSFGKEEGLSGDAITSLACSNSGEIVIVHQRGLDVLNPQTGFFRYFGSESGIREIDPDLNAITKDSYGNIWIGTNSGIIHYRSPGKNFRISPKIILNDVLVYMEPLEEKQWHSFRYNQNHLTFQYTGLWYTNPDDIIFQYWLDDVDPGWITSRDRFTTYSNLSPGHYQFEVRATLTGQISNADTAEFVFHIKTPFWRSVWFYLAAGLLSVFFTGMLVKARESSARKKEMIEREKYTFQFESLRSQVNPHFLFNSFNTLISLIEEDPKAAAKFTDKLSDYFRNILVLRDRELITLREELELVMDYYYLLKSRYAENFVLDLSIPDHFLDSLIPPLTLQMLVENALKHNVVSVTKPLTVEIKVIENALLIRNNVQLKKQPESSTGIGLENILKQYRLIAGKEVKIERDARNFIVIIPIIDKRA